MAQWWLDRLGSDLQGLDSFSQATLLNAPHGLHSVEQLIAALQVVLDRHDILRARLEFDGERGLVVGDPGSVAAEDICRVVEVEAEPGTAVFDAAIVAVLGDDVENSTPSGARWCGSSGCPAYATPAGCSW
ncbi:hypothetical protein GCM10020255_081920 [Rhodococcus baikonurensis]